MKYPKYVIANGYVWQTKPKIEKWIYQSPVSLPIDHALNFPATERYLHPEAIKICDEIGASLVEQ